MVSAFKEKRTVNNGNWWGETGRYWRDIGVNRVDIGAGVDRSVSTRSLFDCESGTSEEQSSIIFANSSWVLWCGNNQVRKHAVE
ncbi:hypothetical protein [Gimesia maris]|uniref:Uncharacterized protein n=1 Tax=Gimesia maris TaxID=122 RepID=A0ABX5YUD0_9PLAN|nr:hypothetical protein [Gimesia maris]QDU17327.1 hypothetical protein CA11_51680 [Gimesia maris]QEG19389.1 hypothetical protein GmarT_52880 [Gimesia maris]QGQ27749.1 hypothetical protein F1729_03260 [Gimesia maris]